MRRHLCRILLNAVTVASAVMCVGAIVLWVRSYIAFDSIVYPTRVPTVSGNAWPGGNAGARGPAIYELATEHGRIRFLVAHPTQGRLPWRQMMTQSYVVLDADDSSADPFRAGWVVGPGPEEHQFLGFRIRRGEWQLGDRCPIRSYEAPLGVLAMLAGAPVVPAMIRWRRQRRRRLRGLCPACGYDLRATPGRCPECGTIPAR